VELSHTKPVEDKPVAELARAAAQL